MSTKVSTRVWHAPDTQNLKHRELVVLLALADIANDDGDVVFKSDKRKEGEQAALAKKARMSESTFRRSIRILKDRGLIEVTRATPTSPNEYRVTMTGQVDLWKQPGSTGQVDPPHRSPGDLSHRSTVTSHRDVFNVTTNPLTPARRGNTNSPNDEVLALLGGGPLATIRTRVCTAHERQRRTCFDCWRIRPLSVIEVPWCGDRNCDQNLHLRLIVSTGGIETWTKCPECHPLAIAPDRAADLLEANR